MSATRYDQFCALAGAAEIVGERWTLLIVRELPLGPKRFSDLAERLAGVSPALLTSRLAALIDNGLVRRVALPFNVQAYELTASGRELQPAIRELIRWGGRFLFPMRPDDHFEPDWVLLGLDAALRRTPTPAHRIGLRVRHGDADALFLVEGGQGGSALSRSEEHGEVLVDTTFDVLLRILSTDLPLDRAIAERRTTVEGPIALARRLPDHFDLSGRRRPGP
ncbi:MAG: winged helix-turn-helix transcriptional regulator [Phenylobacterium sp.]|uniref:winged helix-turn-helix transcriptional regulator n=1 Tax=Phenylobacterium sp. TaxID=1871053 RepID=UPI002736F34C|nr:winged helix-turn-helix transcriptional regulator [Phenylobacterium sp.]MDP3747462.1 winged helix-turn-helix transcriptional regulator [Phenylobacterium sp.]